MSGKQKGNFKVILSVFVLWFFILLPFFRIIIKEEGLRRVDVSDFTEKEEDIQFLIDREKAQFPDQFFLIDSGWVSEDVIWNARWHLYKPYIYDSKNEMDNLVITSESYGSKKKSKQSIAPFQYWAQVYKNLAAPNYSRVENLALAFYWFKEQNELSDRELLEIVVDYVQQIPYELPENPYGLYTPPEIAYINKGDCDSKSIFASVLLKHLGFDTAIFYSSEYRHAMLGINISSTGYYKEMNGKNYYFTEMTAEGWQIGELPADCPDLDFWYISSI